MKYTEYTETTTRTIVERTLTAPREWGCYTSVSNTSLRKKAETCIKRLDVGNVGIAVTLRAVTKFLEGWDKMCHSEKHQKAGVSDTAVREVVILFAEKCIKATGSFPDPEGTVWAIRNELGI
jgi:hypothetical protein